MPNLLNRIVIVLLVPCLVLDSALAQATIRTGEVICPPNSISARFRQQAIIPPIIDVRPEIAGQAWCNVLESLPAQPAKIGPVALAFNILNRFLYDKMPLDANVMLTYKCPFNCRDCFARHAIAEHGFVDAPKEQLFSELDALRGFNRIYLVGTGETIAYGKQNLFVYGVSRDFLEVVSRASASAKEVIICTNGYLFPENLEEARKFFGQFPANVSWMVSVDKFHEEYFTGKPMRDRMGRSQDSLKTVVRILEQLVKEKRIHVYYNMRREANEDPADVARRYGLYDRLSGTTQTIFMNRVLRQGAAADDKKIVGRGLLLDKMFGGGRSPKEFKLFIDPSGFVLSAVPIAYMSDRERAGLSSQYPNENKAVNLGNVMIVEARLATDSGHLAAEMLMNHLTQFKDSLMYPVSNLGETTPKTLETVIRLIYCALLYAEGNGSAAWEAFDKLNLKPKDKTVMMALPALFIDEDGVDLRPFVMEVIKRLDLTLVLEAYRLGGCYVSRQLTERFEAFQQELFRFVEQSAKPDRARAEPIDQLMPRTMLELIAYSKANGIPAARYGNNMVTFWNESKGWHLNIGYDGPDIPRIMRFDFTFKGSGRLQKAINCFLFQPEVFLDAAMTPTGRLVIVARNERLEDVRRIFDKELKAMFRTDGGGPLPLEIISEADAVARARQDGIFRELFHFESARPARSEGRPDIRRRLLAAVSSNDQSLIKAALEELSRPESFLKASPEHRWEALRFARDMLVAENRPAILCEDLPHRGLVDLKDINPRDLVIDGSIKVRLLRVTAVHDQFLEGTDVESGKLESRHSPCYLRIGASLSPDPKREAAVHAVNRKNKASIEEGILKRSS